MTDNTKQYLCVLLTIVIIGLFATSFGKLLVQFIPYEMVKQTGIETTAEIMGYDKVTDMSGKEKFTYKVKFNDTQYIPQYVMCDFSTETVFDSCEKVTIYYDKDNPLTLCIKGVNTGKEYIAPSAVMLLCSVGMIYFCKHLKKQDSNRDY